MITAIVLTHDDEEYVSRCLESLSWSDEIVVVDDYSTDKTVEIAKRYTKRIFLRSLQEDFSAQRNFGLSKAKSEWVLFVDSDEVVTDDLAKEIKLATSPLSSRGMYQTVRPVAISEIASSKTPRNDNLSGYYLKRIDYWGGSWLTHGETGNVRLLRLARKDAGVWIQPVHEVWDVKGSVGELAHPLLHYPHPNVAQFLNQINRYSSMYATYLFHKGIREPWWHIGAKPIFKFFHNYLIRLGFLDGTAGAVVAIMMSFHSFLVRGKLWLLWHKVPRNSMS